MPQDQQVELHAHERTWVADTMNRLPYVRWDRLATARREDGLLDAAVYGWIERDDGPPDFVVLLFEGAAVGSVTSSAKHSEEIDATLHGNADGHVPCQRVEDVLPGVASLGNRHVAAPRAA